MDLPRREALVRVLSPRVFMFYMRYSPRNPQAAHDAEKRDRTQILPFYVITCSGLRGKKRFSTSVPHSQTVLQVSHQGSKQWEPNTSTSSSSRSSQCWLPSKPRILGSQSSSYFFFFKEYNHQKLSLARRLTAA